jgi:hypothetical protein
MFFARLIDILVVHNDGLVGDGSRADLISVLAKEQVRPLDAPTDAEALSEIKARVVQEVWISGRGFLY